VAVETLRFSSNAKAHQILPQPTGVDAAQRPPAPNASRSGPWGLPPRADRPLGYRGGDRVASGQIVVVDDPVAVAWETPTVAPALEQRLGLAVVGFTRGPSGRANKVSSIFSGVRPMDAPCARQRDLPSRPILTARCPCAQHPVPLRLFSHPTLTRERLGSHERARLLHPSALLGAPRST